MPDKSLPLELFRETKVDYFPFIHNPNFSRAAEREILEKLSKLAFPNSKKRILKAISDRKNQVQNQFRICQADGSLIP